MPTIKHSLLALAGLAAFSGPALADHLNIQTDGVMIDGNTVTFPQVKIDGPGFLVIHATNADGTPVVPGSIGHVALEAGISENVSVTLDEAPMDGATYIAMLHMDTGVMGEYEFGEGSTDVDPPALTADGAPYVQAFDAGM